MKKQIIYGLLVSVLLAFCLYVTPSANAASVEEEIIQAVTNFGKAFNTSDFNLMSSLWWHSSKASIFGPGKKEAFLTQGYEQIERIFKSMFELPAGTFDTSSHNVQVTMLGDNAAVITNYVISIFNPPAVKEQTIYQDRGTMVVQKMDGKWLIVHAQVSVLPTE